MSDPFGPPPGLDIDESRQTILWVALLVPYGLALITVILRLLSRKLSNSGAWFDDWLIIGAMAVATGIVAGSIVAINEGLGRHIWVFSEADVGPHSQDILLGLFELDNLFYGCYGAIKISVLAFYWRALKHTFIRRVVFVMNMGVVLWAGVSITMTVLECDPVSGFWIDPLEANCPIPRIPVHVALSIVNAVLNFAIVLLPVPYFIAPHHNSATQNLVLVVLFGMGFFVCALSVIRTLAIANTDIVDVDILFNLSSAWAWSVVEVQAAIIAANLPTLGPVIAKLAPSMAGQFVSTSPSVSTESLDVQRPAMTERRPKKERHSTSSRTGLNPHRSKSTPAREQRSESVDLGFYEADEKYKSLQASVNSWYEGLERTQRVRSLEDAIMEWERSEAAPETNWEHSQPTDWEQALIDQDSIRPLNPSLRRINRRSEEESPTMVNSIGLAIAPPDKELNGTETPPNVEWLRAYEATADQDLRGNGSIPTKPAAFGIDHPLRSNATKRPEIARLRPSRSESSSPSPGGSDGSVPVQRLPDRPLRRHRRTLSYSPDYLRDSARSPDVGMARQMTFTKVRVPSNPPVPPVPPLPVRMPTPPPPLPPPRRQYPPADAIHVRTDVNIDFERWSQIRS